MEVYSTCSLNPIEDEAVVADLIRSRKGQLELVDVSDKLPGLKRRPGISTWKVFDKSLQEFTSIESLPDHLKKVIVSSMFPPTEEEAKEMHLERSFRIFPYDQNSGGFYVAVLRKVKSGDEPVTLRKFHPEQRKRKALREEPFKFLDADEELKSELEEHFGVEKGSFPYENLITRSNNREKNNVSYVNDRLRGILKANEGRLRVISAGTGVMKRVLEKFSPCSYRLKQDGIAMLVKHLRRRVIELGVNDIVTILQGTSDGKHQVRIEVLEGKNAFAGVRNGSVVLQYTQPGTTIKKFICGWLGAFSISPFICREERVHLLAMLGSDYSTLLRQKGKEDKVGTEGEARRDGIVGEQ